MTSDGYGCEVCGDAGDERICRLEGHHSHETTSPTDIAAGHRTHTCGRCGAWRTEPITTWQRQERPA